MKPKKPYRVNGKFAKRPQSRQLKGRYYKPPTKPRKVSDYNKFRKVLREYLQENPEINFRSYGTYSAFTAGIWKEVKGTPIKGIAASIDVIVQDFLSRRNIGFVEFRKKYDVFKWWDTDKGALHPILTNNHVIAGDEVVFDGREYDFPYVKFNIQNRLSWVKKTQLLTTYFGRIFNHSNLLSDEHPEFLLTKATEREDGTWYIEFGLLIIDSALVKIEPTMAAIKLTTDEIEILTEGEEAPEAIPETISEIQPTEKEADKEKIKEETELLKAQTELEREKQKTIEEKMKAVRELTNMGWSQEKIQKYLGL